MSRGGNDKGAPPGAPASPLRRCGPQSAPGDDGTLSREDYVILMPEPEFRAWVGRRRQAVAGNARAAAEEEQSIEADVKLRVWAKGEGERVRAAMQPRPVAQQTGSPLEERLRDAFFASGHFAPTRALSDVVIGFGRRGLLLRQLPVAAARARMDFAIINAEADVFLAIEVDGHDFHERTKAQAQRDRSRDRALIAAGWTVLRFTGSEVHYNASGCVAEVLRLLESLTAPDSQKVG